MKHPSPTIWTQVADTLGTDLATIKAVFEVEAAGKFFNANGSLPRRFEPHHFPKRFWGSIGFAPGKKTPWRASLKIPTTTRRQMFDRAENIDQEAAFDAASWGAPQIMGFNAELAGFTSAVEMVDAMQGGADHQVVAFFNFVVAANLDTYLRSQNWLAFAAGYNGDGQAPVYAAKIESAYRRQSGGAASAQILRVGSQGDAVEDLQEYLNELGYKVTSDGIFGAETLRAVRAFQNSEELIVDGVIGAATQRAILAAVAKTNVQAPAPEPIGSPRNAQPTDKERKLGKLLDRGGAILSGGGVAGVLAALNENSQTILLGGVVLGAIVLGAIYLLKRSA